MDVAQERIAREIGVSWWSSSPIVAFLCHCILGFWNLLNAFALGLLYMIWLECCCAVDAHRLSQNYFPPSSLNTSCYCSPPLLRPNVHQLCEILLNIGNKIYFEYFFLLRVCNFIEFRKFLFFNTHCILIFIFFSIGWRIFDNVLLIC